MKKTFLNFGLFLALGLTTAVFYSCNKDDDNDGGTNGGSVSRITATNVINGSTQIKTVKVLAYWEREYDDGNDAIAQAPFTNNGFTLELPATVGAKYLFLISEEAPRGINISDENAKGLFLEDIRGYDGDDDEIGDFYLEEENGDNEYYTSWFYSDRDVTIKGEDDGEKYNVTLKKGWNVVYDSYTDDSYSLTSQKPSGVNYTWNFYDNSSFRSASIATKSVENTKSAFSKLKESRKKR
jgi:hypothetical protein